MWVWYVNGCIIWGISGNDGFWRELYVELVVVSLVVGFFFVVFCERLRRFFIEKEFLVRVGGDVVVFFDVILILY